MTNQQILVIEDSHIKWKDIQNVLLSCDISENEIERARTVVEAEDLIEAKDWDLILLDVSMDLAITSSGPHKGGHDPLGGLTIANKMFLLAKEAPTILVTAFDTFPTEEKQKGSTKILGLDEIKRSVRDLIGSSLIDCVRYGDDGWETCLVEAMSKVINK